MDKEAICPWCHESIKPRGFLLAKEHGKIKQWRCPKCNRVLAAYLEETKAVLERVRLFQ